MPLTDEDIKKAFARHAQPQFSHKFTRIKPREDEGDEDVYGELSLTLCSQTITVRHDLDVLEKNLRAVADNLKWILDNTRV